MKTLVISLFFLTALFQSEATLAIHRFQLRVVNLDYKKGNNDLKLMVFDSYYLPNSQSFPPRLYSGNYQNDTMYFSFESPQPFMVCKLVDENRKVILEPIIAEPLDSIVISVKQGIPSFSGRGKDKYELIDSINRKISSFSNFQQASAAPRLNGLKEAGDSGYLMISDYFFSHADTINKLAYDRLLGGSITFDEDLKYIILAELTAKFWKQAVKNTHFLYMNGDIAKSEKNVDKTFRAMSHHKFRLPEPPEAVICASPALYDYIYNELSLTEYLDSEGQSFYTSASSRYRGMVRDKLLTHKLERNFNRESNPDSLIMELLQLINYESYRAQLKEIRNNLNKGTLIPDVSLPNANGELVNLQDFKGKVVYLHFYFNGCFPCRALYKHVLSEVETKYRKNDDIVFVSISVDRTKDTWLSGLSKEEYTSKHAVNLFTEEQAFDHKICKQLFVNAAPKAFLFGKDGELISNNVNELGGGGTSKDKLEQMLLNSLKEPGN